MTFLSGILAVERVPVGPEMPKSLLEAGLPGLRGFSRHRGAGNYYLFESPTRLGGSFQFSMGLSVTRDTHSGYFTT